MADGSVIIDTKLDKSGLQKGLATLGKSVGASIAAIGAAIGGLGIAVGKVGIDFESAFAGVKKTVNATDAELEALRKGILNMSKEIPTAATEIAGIAEAAGQLGIKTQNILGFTRVMADLGVATNLTGEAAAQTLAKFANITGMAQEDFDRLGSTIVALGNNLATTEADIAEMAMRLAGAGAQVGLTEAQILSFSGALSSVGIAAEAGGTAFSKLMSDMQLAVETGNEDLQNFAAVSGMSAAQFKQAFKEDASAAMIAFIQGLGTAEQKGMSAIKVLDDMGITEIRMRDALLRAAGASGVFTEAIELGSQAWEENTALTKEAEQRYQTAESKLKMLKNGIIDLGITAYESFEGPLRKGLQSAIDSVDGLKESLAGGELKNAIESLGRSFGALVSGAADLVSSVLPGVLKGLAWIMDNGTAIATIIGSATAAVLSFKAAFAAANLVMGAYKSISTAIGVLTGTHVLLKNTETGAITMCTAAKAAEITATKGATVAQVGLNAAMWANPALLVAGAIAALVAGIVIFCGAANAATKEEKLQKQEMEKLAQEVEDAGKKYEDAKKSIDEATAAEISNATAAKVLAEELVELENSCDGTEQSKQKLKAVVDELNRLMPELSLKIDEQTGRLNKESAEVVKLTDNYYKLAVAKATAAAYEKKMGVAAELIAGARLNKTKNIEKLQNTTAWYDKLTQIITDEDAKAKEDVYYKSPYSSKERKNIVADQKQTLEAIHALRDNIKQSDDQIRQAEEDIKTIIGLQAETQKEIEALMGGAVSDKDDSDSSGGIVSNGLSDKEVKAAKDNSRELIKIYSDNIDEQERLDLRNQKRRKLHGQLTADEEEQVLRDRASRYRHYAVEALTLEGVTAGDKLKLSKEYAEKAQDIEDELYLFRQQRLYDTKKIISDTYAEIAREALNNIDEIERAQERLESKLKGYGNLFRETSTFIKGAGKGLIFEDGSWQMEDDLVITQIELSDINEDVKALEQYQNALIGIRDRLKEIGEPAEFFKLLRDMSIEEGTKFANKLLSLTDDEFTAYLQSWKDKQRLSEGIADAFFTDDYKDAAEEAEREFNKAFGELTENFAGYGEDYANAIEDGFNNAIGEVVKRMKNTVAQQTSGLTESILGVSGRNMTGANSGLGSVAGSTPAGSVFAPTYVLNSSGETVAEQLQSADRHAELQKMRGRSAYAY